MPFMAIDVLLYNIEHTVIYDAESLFYVLIWMTFLYSGPNETKRKMTNEFYDRSILRKWSPPTLGKDVSFGDVARLKKLMMIDPSEFFADILWNRDPFFSALDECLSDLRSALFPPAPLPPRRPTINSMSHRSKEHVLEGMKKALKKAMEKLEKTGGNQPASGNITVGRVVCASLKGAKDLKLRQAIEDLEGDRLGCTVNEERVDNEEAGRQGDHGREPSAFGKAENEEAKGTCNITGEENESLKENDKSNVEERRLTSGQTVNETLESPTSRSLTGKRSASTMNAEAALEPVPSTRPHKRARTARSTMLNGPGSENPE